MALLAYVLYGSRIDLWIPHLSATELGRRLRALSVPNGSSLNHKFYLGEGLEDEKELVLSDSSVSMQRFHTA